VRFKEKKGGEEQIQENGRIHLALSNVVVKKSQRLDYGVSVKIGNNN
jgi:hypothetical protein